MMRQVFLMVAGFAAIITGTTLLVDGVSPLARWLNVPATVIGLTIVAFGTSPPEFVVNLFASLPENSEMVLGNVIGSNILNILLILGLSTLIFPLAVKTTSWFTIPLSLLSALTAPVLAGELKIDGDTVALVSRSYGMILLLFFTVFIACNIQCFYQSADFYFCIYRKKQETPPCGRRIVLLLNGGCLAYIFMKP
ncbi:MAG TPA: hypothetical protein ENF21_09155 [Bacteroidetes bacterium]|nr:hypothetical protein [Bacteroidota bacterium]